MLMIAKVEFKMHSTLPSALLFLWHTTDDIIPHVVH